MICLEDLNIFPTVNVFWIILKHVEIVNTKLSFLTSWPSEGHKFINHPSSGLVQWTFLLLKPVTPCIMLVNSHAWHVNRSTCNTFTVYAALRHRTSVNAHRMWVEPVISRGVWYAVTCTLLKHYNFLYSYNSEHFMQPFKWLFEHGLWWKSKQTAVLYEKKAQKHTNEYHIHAQTKIRSYTV